MFIIPDYIDSNHYSLPIPVNFSFQQVFKPQINANQHSWIL